LPLVLGLVAARAWRGPSHDPGPADGRERPLRWNAVGLAASSLYLAWTVVAQAQVAGRVHDALAGTPLADAPVLVTPTPFNSLLWRVVVMDRGAWHEGYHSLLDSRGRLDLVRHASASSLVEGLLIEDDDVRRLAGFTRGFYGVSEAGPGLRVATTSVSSTRQLLGVVATAAAAPPRDGPPATPIVMTDLRMGQAPWFAFAFVVAEHRAGAVVPVAARQVPTRRPPLTALGWLWRRIWDQDVRWPYSSSQIRDT
jgi:inner membrane protein